MVSSSSNNINTNLPKMIIKQLDGNSLNWTIGQRCWISIINLFMSKPTQVKQITLCTLAYRLIAHLPDYFFFSNFSTFPCPLPPPPNFVPTPPVFVISKSIFQNFDSISIKKLSKVSIRNKNGN